MYIHVYGYIEVDQAGSWADRVSIVAQAFLFSYPCSSSRYYLYLRQIPHTKIPEIAARLAVGDAQQIAMME